MATIVQEYGPIYGETVNGTVQGRPNGSVYVPLSNKIHLSANDNRIYFNPNSPTKLYIVDGVLVADSQDLASNLVISVYSDAELTTLFATSNVVPAGLFNFTGRFRIGTKIEGQDIVDEDPYYLVVELMNNGEAVATSDVLEVIGSVPS